MVFLPSATIDDICEGFLQIKGIAEAWKQIKPGEYYVWNSALEPVQPSQSLQDIIDLRGSLDTVISGSDGVGRTSSESVQGHLQIRKGTRGGAVNSPGGTPIPGVKRPRPAPGQEMRMQEVQLAFEIDMRK